MFYGRDYRIVGLHILATEIKQDGVFRKFIEVAGDQAKRSICFVRRSRQQWEVDDHKSFKASARKFTLQRGVPACFLQLHSAATSRSEPFGSIVHV